MITISDTSPLSYLVLLGCESVLPRLYADISIPGAVHAELLDVRAPVPVRAWANQPPSWLHIYAAPAVIPSELSHLDPGEAEAIALAIQLSAGELIMDERPARRVAQSLGFRVIGTLGVLREAGLRGLLHLPTEVRRVRDAGLYVTDKLVAETLRGF